MRKSLRVAVRAVVLAALLAFPTLVFAVEEVGRILGRVLEE